MKLDICNYLSACTARTEDRLTRPRQKLNEENKLTYAGATMGENGVDNFNALGATWLELVDQCSWYA